MTSCKRLFAFLLFFAAVCFGQSDQGTSAWIRLEQIDNVLHSAGVSGSLIYQGYCDRTLPEAPPVRVASDHSGSPTKILQEMLADIPNMRVTQEPGGLVRMESTNVLTDLLDFRIHDLAFYSPSAKNSIGHGANMALIALEMNPEVRAFRKEHNIGPDFDGFGLPGDAASGKPIVYGHLEDVTFSQGLDYILQTFPGFWIYEDCVNPEEERTVRLSFYERPFSSKQR